MGSPERATASAAGAASPAPPSVVEEVHEGPPSADRLDTGADEAGQHRFGVGDAAEQRAELAGAVGHLEPAGVVDGSADEHGELLQRRSILLVPAPPGRGRDAQATHSAVKER